MRLKRKLLKWSVADNRVSEEVLTGVGSGWVEVSVAFGVPVILVLEVDVAFLFVLPSSDEAFVVSS